MVLRNSGRVGSRRLTEESPVSDIGTGDLLFWTFAHKGYAIGDIFPDFVNAYPKNLLRTIVQYVDVVS